MNDPDELLMDRLRAAALAVDPVPAHVEEAARAALSARRLDEELAELVLDSELAAPGLVRSDDAEVRLLSFETGPVSVELQVRNRGRARSVRGLAAGSTGPIDVEQSGVARRVEPDADGWFGIEEIPAGATRLRLRAADGAAVTTAWVLL